MQHPEIVAACGKIPFEAKSMELFLDVFQRFFGAFSIPTLQGNSSKGCVEMYVEKFVVTAIDLPGEAEKFLRTFVFADLQITQCLTVVAMCQWRWLTWSRAAEFLDDLRQFWQWHGGRDQLHHCRNRSEFADLHGRK